MICGRCGTKFIDNTKFCNRCGGQLNPENMTQQYGNHMTSPNADAFSISSPSYPTPTSPTGNYQTTTNADVYGMANPQSSQFVPQSTNYQVSDYMGTSHLACPMCSATNPVVQVMFRKKSIGRHIVEFLLILLPVIGWAILVYSIATDFRSFKAATCQKCGHCWDIMQPYRKIN